MAAAVPTDANELARACAEAILARDKAMRGLGIEILEVGPGFARTRMRIRDDMTNGHGIGHGGLTFTLGDSTLAFACNSRNQVALAAHCAIDFLRPVHRDDVLVATATEQSIRGRHGIYDVRIDNQNGETVALFRGKSTQIKATVLEGPDGSARA